MPPSPFDVDKADLMAYALERLGVRHRSQHRGWQKVRCPGELHARGDRNPSASVNLVLGKFHCHGCGLHGDGFDLLLAVDGESAVALQREGLTALKESATVSEWIL